MIGYKSAELRNEVPVWSKEYTVVLRNWQELEKFILMQYVCKDFPSF